MQQLHVKNATDIPDVCIRTLEIASVTELNINNRHIIIYTPDMAASVTFPRATFAKLSPHPFLLANLNPNTPDVPSSRTNGRSPTQFRTPQISVSSLSHAHGSAVVRTGDTTVMCGVRAEILPVASIPQYRPADATDARATGTGRGELKDYDLIVPNIELATGCAPNFLPGGPPSTMAQTLSTRVYELLHSCQMLDVADLRIWHDPKASGVDDENMEEGAGDEIETAPELKAYWTLYIDLLFVSFDGNPFDAAWAAIVAALRDTKLPVARWDVDREMVVCSRQNTKKLTVSGMPIACSAAVFLEKEHGAAGEGNHWVLLDPDRLEDGLCQENVTVVVDRSSGKTRVRSLSKSGGTVVGVSQLKELVALAEKRWEEFAKVMPTA